MHREIEAKYRIESAQALKGRLRPLGARPVASISECNTMFDTPERKLLTAGCGLRLREATQDGDCIVRLTYKGPTKSEGVKDRLELETHLSDVSGGTLGCGSAMHLILLKIGFVPTVIYGKRRELWRFADEQRADVEVAIDELPRAGWFVEIEAASEKQIARVAAELGLGEADLVRETYVAMAARLGVRDSGSGEIRLQFVD